MKHNNNINNSNNYVIIITANTYITTRFQTLGTH